MNFSHLKISFQLHNYNIAKWNIPQLVLKLVMDVFTIIRPYHFFLFRKANKNKVQLLNLTLSVSHMGRQIWEIKYIYTHNMRCLVAQGHLSMEFSRLEHWSGLPFPSPRHKSEKCMWSRSVMCDSSRPHGLQPTRLLHPWDFPGKSTGAGCHCLLRPTLLNILKFLIRNI